ncbi:MAG: DNA-3-methyladenine glycosylase [Candidatus Chlorobium antarcticum]|nr:DNA-3-methyladenine glycosylase [Candidatus Chlorobium antarcticum]
MVRLEKQFFDTPTLQLAQALLGKTFVRILPRNTILKGRIVETEAYLGENDEASHAHRGETERNRPMFEAPGTLYVYFTYGCHHLVNIVSEPEHTAGAVLLRAMEPVEGTAFMERQRGKVEATNLMSGPAKIAQALNLTRSHSGRNMFGAEFFLEDAPSIPETDIGTSSRIGISQGKELQWRKFVIGSPYLSKGRPS